MGDTKLISLRMPVELLAAIDLLAASEKRSRAQVIILKLQGVEMITGINQLLRQRGVLDAEIKAGGSEGVETAAASGGAEYGDDGVNATDREQFSDRDAGREGAEGSGGTGPGAGQAGGVGRRRGARTAAGAGVRELSSAQINGVAEKIAAKFRGPGKCPHGYMNWMLCRDAGGGCE